MFGPVSRPGPMRVMLFVLGVPDPRPRRVQCSARHARPVVVVRAQQTVVNGKHVAIVRRETVEWR